jgi:hypothetical protein
VAGNCLPNLTDEARIEETQITNSRVKTPEAARKITDITVTYTTAKLGG